MFNTITEKRITFKMPESITRSEDVCPDCLVRYYIVNGKEICGECMLEKAHEDKINTIKDHYKKNGDPMGNFNRAIQLKKDQQREKKEDYKKLQYKD